MAIRILGSTGRALPVAGLGSWRTIESRPDRQALLDAAARGDVRQPVGRLARADA